MLLHMLWDVQYALEYLVNGMYYSSYVIIVIVFTPLKLQLLRTAKSHGNAEVKEVSYIFILPGQMFN